MNNMTISSLDRKLSYQSKFNPEASQSMLKPSQIKDISESTQFTIGIYDAKQIYDEIERIRKSLGNTLTYFNERSFSKEKNIDQNFS